MSPIIETSALTKRYPGADRDAVNGISLSVEPGSLFGLIGADGAGKSTFLKILATLVVPGSGAATVLGSDVRSAASTVRVSIGYMPQRFSLYQDLSVAENLSCFADVFGVVGQERDKRLARLLAFARLEKFRTRRAGNLSGGMKQKLSLCCALVHSPKLLILDEPTTGVDPVSRNEFWAILKDLVAQGVTILVSTPYMDETRYCDKLAIMHEGRVVCEGGPVQLIESFDKTIFSAEGVDTLPPPELPMPAGFVRYYPGGGEMRIVAHSTVSEAAVNGWLQSWCPRAPGAMRAEAAMEDVFIDRVALTGSRSNVPNPQHGKGG